VFCLAKPDFTLSRGDQPLTEPDGPDWRFRALATLGLGAIWLGLTGGEARALVIGLPVVSLAVMAAEAAEGGRYLPALWRLPGFAVRFGAEIAVSAWDVTRRVLARDPAFRPGLMRYRVRLQGEGARAAFMNAVTLTPGTLSAGLAGDALTVHALDPSPAVTQSLLRLEARIAGLYGEALA
jgi:multisubunit Na+/H+ antiporter MnhE subunit